ncbi:MAG: GNAT family N-acetyltransferase, partial [Nocardioides sp.]
MSDVEITGHLAQHRYEARVDGVLAGFAEFELTEHAVVFTHTAVEDAFEGHGVGSTLARFVLDDARNGAHGARRVVVKCPFIK